MISNLQLNLSKNPLEAEEILREIEQLKARKIEIMKNPIILCKLSLSVAAFLAFSTHMLLTPVVGIVVCDLRFAVAVVVAVSSYCSLFQRRRIAAGTVKNIPLACRCKRVRRGLASAGTRTKFVISCGRTAWEAMTTTILTVPTWTSFLAAVAIRTRRRASTACAIAAARMLSTACSCEIVSTFRAMPIGRVAIAGRRASAITMRAISGTVKMTWQR